MNQVEMPTTGGSYIRHIDGSLELVEGSITASAELTDPAPEPTPEAIASPTRKVAAKTPSKE